MEHILTDRFLAQVITDQDILKQIAKLNAERDKKINTLNMRQRMLNTERQAIYAEYEEKINAYQKALDSLNGRNSGKSHP